MIKKIREYISLDDVIEYWLDGKRRFQSKDDILEYEVLSVVDEHGNVSVPSLDIVIEVTIDDDIDEKEQTPEQENGWLRDAGF